MSIGTTIQPTLLVDKIGNRICTQDSRVQKTNFTTTQNENTKKKNITKTIVENDIKSVIFSQICDGWTNIIEAIKKEKTDIKIKVIWHGNCYEYFSDFTWNLNKEVMNLYKQKKIDCLMSL